ncbi:MAG: metallophosphoesterase [Elusimicrobiales bacterium]|nr:metallophosphoesterase [Elusimicrobiales bacterium]
MKQHHFLPVFIALVVFYVGLHFYAARWLTRSFGLSQTAAAALRVTLLCAAFLSPFTMFLKRQYHTPVLEAFYAAGYAWMGVILIAAFIFLLSDLAALPLRRWLPAVTHLPRLTLGALACILAWSLYGGLKNTPLKEVLLPVPGLPPSLDGLRIAQISDMHVDSGWKLRQFNALVGAVNAANPDLILITGDLIDPGLTCREDLRDSIAGLRSRLGIYGVLGNHEYYYGLDKAMACYQAFGIRLLKNETADLGDLKLIGFGDVHTENLSGAYVSDLLAKAGNGKFRLVMTHQPVYYPEIAAAGAGLTLSGHTHRGQIFPFHIFTRLAYKYFYGLYRINNSAFYVTSGAGTWGPPLRWLAAAEVPLITLKKQ